MRLNNYNATPKRRGLGKEDMIHKAFAKTVEAYKSINKLNCAWYSYDASGEKRNIITGALLKAKGLKAGHPDYMFKVMRDNTAHYIYIEFKTETGKLSLAQKLFRDSCTGENETFYVARSASEGLDILKGEGIILD